MAARGVKFVNPFEFDANDGGLNFIKATVITNHLMIVTHCASMIAQNFQFPGYLFVLCDNHAAIAVAG